MKDHATLAREFIKDSARTDWHDETLWFVRHKRDKAAHGLPEWEQLREWASQIKNHALSNLDTYLELFEKKATENGAVVHWAADAAEHNRIIHSIIKENGISRIVKSKSMLTEECHLNHYLEEKGIEVVDTDLGERIVQFRKEAPSHIVLPAIHLKKKDVSDTFHEHLHRRLPACPFPPTVLKALANSMRADDGLLEAQALAQRAGVALLRVTGLLGCTRQAWYGLHAAPPLEKPSEHWSRLRGTIFHAALESLAGENAVAETRLIASLEELGACVWIVGKIDHYDPALRLLTDYKSVNSFGRKMASLDLPKQHHIAQLWIYSWLLAKSGYPYPLAGRVVYMDMGAVRTVDVPMPDTDLQAAVEARLVEKARLITEADAGGAPGGPQGGWEWD